MEIKKCPFCGGIGELTMDEKIEVKANKELYNDLSSIMSEEYEKRMLITPSYCANKLLEKGYRKDSDTAREICLKIIKVQPQPIKEKWVEWFKEEYGVDLGE